jgi:hypothetical protein
MKIRFRWIDAHRVEDMAVEFRADDETSFIAEAVDAAITFRLNSRQRVHDIPWYPAPILEMLGPDGKWAAPKRLRATGKALPAGLCAMSGVEKGVSDVTFLKGWGPELWTVAKAHAVSARRIWSKTMASAGTE